MAKPVAFSILTNIVAFFPLYFIPGMIGKAWKVIPLVVVVGFHDFVIEALLVLRQPGPRPCQGCQRLARSLQSNTAGVQPLILKNSLKLFLARF